MANLNLMQRQKILNKTGCICAKCGKQLSLNNFTVDHYIPRSLHGGSAMANLVPLCFTCNVEKGDSILSPDDAYPYLNMLHKSELDDELYNFCKHRKLFNFKGPIENEFISTDEIADVIFRHNKRH